MLKKRKLLQRELVELSTDLLPLRSQLVGSFDKQDKSKLWLAVKFVVVGEDGNLGEIYELNVEARLVCLGNCTFGKVRHRIWAIDCDMPQSNGKPGKVHVPLGGDLRYAWHHLMRAVEERAFHMVRRIYRRLGVILRRRDVVFTFRCPGDRPWLDDEEFFEDF